MLASRNSTPTVTFNANLLGKETQKTILPPRAERAVPRARARKTARSTLLGNFLTIQRRLSDERALSRARARRTARSALLSERTPALVPFESRVLQQKPLQGPLRFLFLPSSARARTFARSSAQKRALGLAFNQTVHKSGSEAPSARFRALERAELRARPFQLEKDATLLLTQHL